jgi:hypothetical protein
VYRGDDRLNPFKLHDLGDSVEELSDEFAPEQVYLLLSFAMDSDENLKRPRPISMSGLEVLRTCKQIHDEGVDVLYRKNVFQFDSCRSQKRLHALQKWLLPNQVRESNDIWSPETLKEVSQLLQECDSPYWMLFGSVDHFIQAIGKKNAARVAKINYRVFLSPLGCSASGGPFSYGHDTSEFVEAHNALFKHSLTSLKDLRLVGYWNNHCQFSRPHEIVNYVMSSPNFRNVPSNSDNPRRLFYRVSKMADTLIHCAPATDSTPV